MTNAWSYKVFMNRSSVVQNTTKDLNVTEYQVKDTVSDSTLQLTIKLPV